MEKLGRVRTLDTTDETSSVLLAFSDRDDDDDDRPMDAPLVPVCAAVAFL